MCEIKKIKIIIIKHLNRKFKLSVCVCVSE